MSKSKPIRTHFCCTPPPYPVASPRTDDVTVCCEHCFHGNAHHRFGLHFRQLSLPPFSNTPPPQPTLHSLSLPLSLSVPSRPAAQPLHHSPDEKEGLGHKRRGRATERKLTAADRKKKRDIHRRTRLKKFQLWTGCFAGRVVLSCV